MAEIIPGRRARIRWTLIVLAAAALLRLSSPRAAADTIVMFTASTDYTGNVPDGGYSYPNDPTQQNPNLPSISNGVTLSSGSGGLSNTAVGPLDGTTYGPYGFGNNAGGTTGWVTSCYTFTTGGTYRLAWEVANVFGSQGYDALATDNITLNGNKLYDFSSGLPSGFTAQGSTGTSSGVPGLNPSGGDSAFAWMDVNPNTSTNVAPIFDTSGDVFSASQLYSAAITVQAGDMLCIDVAFITNGGIYPDYSAVELQSVPEPSSLVLAATGFLGVVSLAWRRRVAMTQR